LFNFKRIEETIIVEPYKNYWKEWYTEEIEQLGNIFKRNSKAIEH